MERPHGKICWPASSAGVIVVSDGWAVRRLLQRGNFILQLGRAYRRPRTEGRLRTSNAMPTTLQRKKVKKHFDPSEDVLGEIQRVLDNMDWDAYWRKVGEGVAKEVDAYAAARARSREQASQRMFR